MAEVDDYRRKHGLKTRGAGRKRMKPKKPADTQPAVEPLIFPPDNGLVMVLPVSVHDGDTVHFCFLIKGRARLARINAPELNTPEGVAAAAYLASIMPKVAVPAECKGLDKYGRALIDFQDGKGRSLSDLMVAAGHAKYWDGEGVKPT